MAYLIVSCRTGKQEEVQGPTFFGDMDLDDKTVRKLKGEAVEPSTSESDRSRSNSVDGELGLSFVSDFAPRMVLNRLDELGYKFLSFGMGSQSAIWTLYLPKEEPVAGKKAAAAKKAPAKRGPKKAAAVDEVENENPAGTAEVDGKAKTGPSKSRTKPPPPPPVAVPVATVKTPRAAAKKAPPPATKPAAQPVNVDDGSDTSSESESEDEESAEDNPQPVSAKSAGGNKPVAPK